MTTFNALLSRVIRGVAWRLPTRVVRGLPPRWRFRLDEYSNLFEGAWPTVEAARRAMPRVRPAGYDHVDAANLYAERLDTIFDYDREALDALREVRPHVAHIVDLGGHVGLSYYAFGEALSLGDARVRWTVVDVAAIVEAGARLAADRGVMNLAFEQRLHDVDETDVLLAAGSLQYLDDDLGTLLRSMRALPRHVILNKTPLTDGEAYVTVQNIGVAYCPYHVRRRADVASQMQALGYTLVRRWTNAGLSCVPHDRPEVGVVGYDGAWWRLWSDPNDDRCPRTDNPELQF